MDSVLTVFSARPDSTDVPIRIVEKAARSSKKERSGNFRFVLQKPRLGKFRFVRPRCLTCLALLATVSELTTTIKPEPLVSDDCVENRYPRPQLTYTFGRGRTTALISSRAWWTQGQFAAVSYQSTFPGARFSTSFGAASKHPRPPAPTTRKPILKLRNL